MAAAALWAAATEAATVAVAATPPVVMRQGDAPEDMICSICMTLPVDPVLTPCDHMFCKGCIYQALESNQCCPVDRSACTINQLRQPQGFVLRIWSNIKVKCGHHDDGCAWNGSIGDYQAHTLVCSRACNDSQGNNNGRALGERVEALEHENRQLKEKFRSANLALLISRQNNNESKNEIDNLKNDIDSLKENLRDAKKLLKSRPNVPGLFHGHYNFKRDDVVQLSQLISRYLENKPDNIDANKIYNCVHACYRDLEKGYSDNPEFYYIDMRMLLATCLASTWFTDNQRNNFQHWLREQF